MIGKSYIYSLIVVHWCIVMEAILKIVDYFTEKNATTIKLHVIIYFLS
jgi:hypothetical protein